MTDLGVRLRRVTRVGCGNQYCNITILMSLAPALTLFSLHLARFYCLWFSSLPHIIDPGLTDKLG
jgi:hypothetical protein